MSDKTFPLLNPYSNGPDPEDPTPDEMRAWIEHLREMARLRGEEPDPQWQEWLDELPSPPTEGVAP
jgi:hypothetical protein